MGERQEGEDRMGEVEALRVGIVGTGAVASAFAKVLGTGDLGPVDVTLWGRRSVRAREVAEAAGVGWAGELEGLAGSTVIVLAVSDGAAGTVAREVAAALADDAAPTLLHTGGAHAGRRAMGGEAASRFELGSVHPLVAVPKSLAPGARPFDGMPFAVEGTGARSLGHAKEIVARLGGDVLELPRGADPDAVKLRYHALATMVATGVVALVDRASRELATSPEEARAFREAYGKLAQSAARNVTDGPGQDVLTGALARGDEELIAEHGRSLAGSSSERLYREILRAARGMLEGS